MSPLAQARAPCGQSLCLTHVCIIGFYPGGRHMVSGVRSLSILVRLLGMGQVQVSGQSPPSPPTW